MKWYKVLTLGITISISNGLGFGQEMRDSLQVFRYKNSIDIEAFGHGGYYSINYERIFLNKSKFKLSGQVGFQYIKGLTIPVSINQLTSFGNHHLEFGIGHSVIFLGPPTGPELIILAKLCYRYQKPNGRLLFKVGFTPFIPYRVFKGFFPWGGITFGFNF